MGTAAGGGGAPGQVSLGVAGSCANTRGDRLQATTEARRGLAYPWGGGASVKQGRGSPGSGEGNDEAEGVAATAGLPEETTTLLGLTAMLST